MAQKQITDNPPTPKQSKAPTAPPIIEYKPIPPELKVILDGFEDLEGIIYGMRQKIYQLHGVVEYSEPKSEPAPTPKPIITTGNKAIDKARWMFPEDIEAKLNFEEKGNDIIIKLKEFLRDKDTFAKIAGTIKEAGGEYISDGKNTHFRLPKKI
jgi:SepF-like predicted cell division protein (DUF552 family)